jgi:hypothetical protein
VTPEAVQLVAGLNSELLPQKSKQRYIGQLLLTKVCKNYSLIHKFLINHILLQTVLLLNRCLWCLSPKGVTSILYCILNLVVGRKILLRIMSD